MEESEFAVSLTVKDAGEALDFYAKALGTQELYRMSMPDGSVSHAEFMLGNTRLLISGEYEPWQALALPEGKAAPCVFGILSEDCDAAFRQAVDAGCTAIEEPTDQIRGWRTALVRDPYGYRWNFRRMNEELSPEEIMQRAQALMGGE